MLVRALGPPWSPGSAFFSRVGCGGGEYASPSRRYGPLFGPRRSRGSSVAGPFLSNATCSPSALISRHKVGAIEECLRLCELRRIALPSLAWHQRTLLRVSAPPIQRSVGFAALIGAAGCEFYGHWQGESACELYSSCDTAATFAPTERPPVNRFLDRADQRFSPWHGFAIFVAAFCPTLLSKPVSRFSL